MYQSYMYMCSDPEHFTVVNISTCESETLLSLSLDVVPSSSTHTELCMCLLAAREHTFQLQITPSSNNYPPDRLVKDLITELASPSATDRRFLDYLLTMQTANSYSSPIVLHQGSQSYLG